MHFLDEVLFQDMVHINDLLFQVALGILSSSVACQPSYFTWTIFLFSSFLSLLVGFKMKTMKICGDIMGLGLWESFQGPLTRY